MKLDDHIDALRELDGDDHELAGATKLRVRRSLEHGHGMRRHAGVVAALAVLLVASASWALATGKIQKLWRAPVAVEQVAPTPSVPSVPPTAPTPPQKLEAQVELPPELPTPPAPPNQTPTIQGVAGVSPLYQKAHELYFHDADYDKALVAWDDYLAKEPNGQFSVEARYNRALCLIHLSRFQDAHDALLPFANGEVAPAGYRQDEAKRLETKLQIRLNGTP
jgi:TolA-binding protein